MAYLESKHSRDDDAPAETNDAFRIKLTTNGYGVALPRRVHWENDAMLEIIEFSPMSEALVNATTSEKMEPNESCCWTCITELFSPTAKIKEKKKSTASCTKDRLKAMGIAPDAGYLWKLCKDVPMTPESFTDLLKWRRRRFAVENMGPGKAQIAYLSEKGEDFDVACDIGRRTVLKIELLAPVDIESMDRASVEMICAGLVQYQCAFGVGRSSKALSPTSLAEQLPQTMHPFKISADVSRKKGGCQCVVLGTASPEARDWWLNEIKQMRKKIGCSDDAS